MALGVVNLLTCFVLVEMVVAFRWKDCANDPQTAAFTFNAFKVWPFPATIPGEIHFSADLTVNRPVQKLYIDEDLDEAMYGRVFQMPCLGQGIGTCNNIDCCRYQELNIPELWEKFMFYILGNESVCPVQSKSVLIQDEIVQMPTIPSPFVPFSKNNFTVRLHFKDEMAKQEHIGCLEFDFEFTLLPKGPVTAAVIGRRDAHEYVDNS